jgi:DNA-binding transcriptional ArsR family regulator
MSLGCRRIGACPGVTPIASSTADQSCPPRSSHTFIPIEKQLTRNARAYIFNHMVEYRGTRLDRVFSAVADPTRRAILRSLKQGPATVTEIARSFPVSLNAVSKHIMVLEQAGLLRREIQGRQHHCRLVARPLRQATAWLDHYRRFWDIRLDALEQHLARKKRHTH